MTKLYTFVCNIHKKHKYTSNNTKLAFQHLCTVDRNLFQLLISGQFSIIKCFVIFVRFICLAQEKKYFYIEN